MEPVVFTPTYEVFLVLEHARACLPTVGQLLGPLAGGPLPEPLGSDIYYRSETDVALLAIRFDERHIDHAALTWLEQVAIGAGVPILDPSRLSERDRRRFYASYLNKYEVQLEDMTSPARACAELGLQLRITGRPRRAASELMTPEDTQVPIFVGPSDAATPVPKRETEPPLPGELNGRRLGSTPPEQQAAPDPVKRLVTERSDAPEMPDRVEPGSGPVTAVEDVQPAVIARIRPRGKQRQRTRRDTAPATPLAKTPERETKGGRKVANGSGPHTSLQPTPPPPEIDVRYLRGSDWMHARLRSLSVKGAFLATGATPRVGDTVYVALGFRGFGAMVPGEVYHVTPADQAPSIGMCGFAVRFSQQDSDERRELIALLRRARSAGVTIKPPPPRVAVRLPVHWPVHLALGASELDVSALDVSSGGMFVRTETDLDERDMLFRVPLDNDDAAIRGRARAVRKVSDQMALQRGLQCGYGLLILELSDLDERRWSYFLERIRKRAETQLVVAAAPARLKQLTGALVSCGYAVTGTTDATSLMTHLRQTRRPPDGALLDPSLHASRTDRARIADALATLGVPTASAAHYAPPLARQAVDRLLGISV